MIELGLGLAAVFTGLFGILVGVAIMGMVIALLVVPYFLFNRESQSLPAPDAPVRSNLLR